MYSGKHDTTWKIPRSITFSPLHIMSYRGKSTSFGTVYITQFHSKVLYWNKSKQLFTLFYKAELQKSQKCFIPIYKKQLLDYANLEWWVWLDSPNPVQNVRASCSRTISFLQDHLQLANGPTLGIQNTLLRQKLKIEYNSALYLRDNTSFCFVLFRT